MIYCERILILIKCSPEMRCAMSWTQLLKELEKEIETMKKEIAKREEVVRTIKALEGGSAAPKRAKRGPGRPPMTGAKRGRKPGVKPGPKPRLKPGPKPRLKPGRKPGRPAVAKKPLRRQYERPVGEMILEVLKTMRTPALVDALVEKVHQKHPGIGGVKYRAIIPSIISRDSKFKRVGKNKVKY
jgi:hypothetical protein